MTSKIRVLIADDHSLVRAGIRLLLEDQSDIEVVGEAGGGCEVVEQAARLQPDVVLMDIAMNDLSGLEATAQITERLPQTRVLALTMHDREEYFFAMLQAGALGYVLKESQPDELVAAIRAVHRGEAYLSPSVTKAVVTDYLAQRGGQNQSRYGLLTPREKEILRLVADGKTTREISELLYLSEKTVEKHRASIMHTLGLQSLSQLIKYAIRKGLIEVDD
jgi:DNA-binding NarL/FixJ family response regulator